MHKFHIHDGYNLLTIGLMVLAYFIASVVEGEIMKITELIGVTRMLFVDSNISWLVYFLAITITSVFEFTFSNLVK